MNPALPDKPPASYQSLLERVGGLPPAVLLAASGGGDSAGAAEALARWRETGWLADLRLVCLDHQLHPDSAQWCALAKQQADRLGLDYVSQSLPAGLDIQPGSLEANARQARYQQLFAAVRALNAGNSDRHWVLVTAHHRDDQAETVLLNLLRGSGSRGLRGMQSISERAGVLHWRAFLDVRGSQLKAWAQAHPVADDPSNRDIRHRRNWIRHHILPELQVQVGHAVDALAHSAQRAADEHALLAQLAVIDAFGSEQSSLDGAWLSPLQWPDRLNALPVARRLNLLRTFISANGFQLPPTSRLTEFGQQVATAADDRLPRLIWDGAELRFYNRQIFVFEALPEKTDYPQVWPEADFQLLFGSWLYARLPCDQDDKTIFADGAAWSSLTATGVRIAARSEAQWQIRGLSSQDRWPLANKAGHKPLRKYLSEQKVPPWWRDCAQVLAIDSQPAVVWAAGEAWVSPAFAARADSPDCWRVKRTGRS